MHINVHMFHVLVYNEHMGGPIPTALFVIADDEEEVHEKLEQLYQTNYEKHTYKIEYMAKVIM
jgi:hypothetical protein